MSKQPNEITWNLDTRIYYPYDVEAYETALNALPEDERTNEARKHLAEVHGLAWRGEAGPISWEIRKHDKSGQFLMQGPDSFGLYESKEAAQEAAEEYLSANPPYRRVTVTVADVWVPTKMSDTALKAHFAALIRKSGRLNANDFKQRSLKVADFTVEPPGFPEGPFEAGRELDQIETRPF